MAEVAGRARLTIRFDDPKLEQQRQRSMQDSRRPPTAATPSATGPTQAAPPPLAPPSDAILRALAEQERKRLQVIRTPTVRRFEARDQGMVQFGSVEKVEGRHFALLHRQGDTLVLSIDEATYRRLTSFTRGRTLHLHASGSIRLGRGHRR